MTAAPAAGELRLVRLIVVAWLVGDLLLVGLHLIGQAFLTGYPQYLFHLDREGNAPSWFSSIQIAFISFTWFGIALTLHISQSARRVIIGTILVAVALLVASLDEAAFLHEQLALATLDSTFPLTGYWVFIYLGIVAAGTVAVLLLAGKLLLAHGAAFRLLAAGGALFILSAGGVELTFNFLGGTNLEGIQAIVEETGEFLGTTLGLYGSLRLLVELRAPAPPLA